MQPSSEGNPEERKPYTKPEIVHELDLEVRAGSPLMPDPLDPLNMPDNSGSLLP